MSADQGTSAAYDPKMAEEFWGESRVPLLVEYEGTITRTPVKLWHLDREHWAGAVGVYTRGIKADIRVTRNPFNRHSIEVSTLSEATPAHVDVQHGNYGTTIRVGWGGGQRGIEIYVSEWVWADCVAPPGVRPWTEDLQSVKDWRPPKRPWIKRLLGVK